VGETPPVPPKKSRTGLIVVAAVVVLALIAGGAFFLVKSLTGEDKHSISIPASAGGMKRDKAKESELEQQITAIETQFKTQANSKSVVYVKSGLYNQDDTKRGPKGALLFLGAKVKSAEGNPAKFVKDFKRVASANELKVTDVSAGKGGGKAVCAMSAVEGAPANAICAWATHDSTGELLPSVPGYDAKKLAALMRDVRSDVEQTD